MSRIKLGLIGCNGRMGKYARNVLSDYSNIKLVMGTDKEQGRTGDLERPIYYPAESILSALEDTKPDIALYFSKPAASVVETIDEVLIHDAKPIIATTGFDEEQRKSVVDAIKKAQIPAAWASNFATGIPITKHLVKEALRLVGNAYDIEVLEGHHNMKADGPSGTLNDIIEAIKEVRPDYEVVYRQPGPHPRKKKEIGVSYQRAGDIPGIHNITISGNQEMLTIKHIAFSPEVFVRGALGKVVPWLHEQKEPGIYSYEDILGLK